MDLLWCKALAAAYVAKLSTVQQTFIGLVNQVCSLTPKHVWQLFQQICFCFQERRGHGDTIQKRWLQSPENAAAVADSDEWYLLLYDPGVLSYLISLIRVVNGGWKLEEKLLWPIHSTNLQWRTASYVIYIPFLRLQWHQNYFYTTPFYTCHVILFIKPAVFQLFVWHRVQLPLSDFQTKSTIK